MFWLSPRKTNEDMARQKGGTLLGNLQSKQRHIYYLRMQTTN